MPRAPWRRERQPTVEGVDDIAAPVQPRRHQAEQQTQDGGDGRGETPAAPVYVQPGDARDVARRQPRERAGQSDCQDAGRHPGRGGDGRHFHQ
jgi:hypothetical protein